jgi:ferric-dicitrate binding protein FerR (iron transport regulator)
MSIMGHKSWEGLEGLWRRREAKMPAPKKTDGGGLAKGRRPRGGILMIAVAVALLVLINWLVVYLGRMREERRRHQEETERSRGSGESRPGGGGGGRAGATG